MCSRTFRVNISAFKVNIQHSFNRFLLFENSKERNIIPFFILAMMLHHMTSLTFYERNAVKGDKR